MPLRGRRAVVRHDGFLSSAPARRRACRPRRGCSACTAGCRCCRPRRPRHRAGRHEAALGRLDRSQVARAAGLARDAVVGRVHEADELGALAVEQRVRALGIGARRVVPGSRDTAAARARVVARGRLARRARVGALAGYRHLRVAAVAIGAAQQHRRDSRASLAGRSRCGSARSRAIFRGRFASVWLLGRRAAP